VPDQQERRTMAGASMRSILDMDNIQIEITNACQHSCSNCTRFCGHYPKPYFMELEYFKKAVDSMVGYPKMVGVMGGEPLLHPQFAEFCEYLRSKIPTAQCGLWSTFPKGKEHYREIIVETFGNIFLNDQSRDDVLHTPILAASGENKNMEQWYKDYLIDHCWIQNSWSASINPRGAYFCEVAAALSELLGEGVGWDITTTPQWWTKVPKDFVAQMDTYCKLCGASIPMLRRSSVSGIDDISPKLYERLKATSPKIKAGKYVISNMEICNDTRPVATYKDQEYRDKIAARYGMFLTYNERAYNTPNLRKDWKPEVAA
jgi:hypothetical protein